MSSVLAAPMPVDQPIEVKISLKNGVNKLNPHPVAQDFLDMPLTNEGIGSVVKQRNIIHCFIPEHAQESNVLIYSMHTKVRLHVAQGERTIVLLTDKEPSEVAVMIHKPLDPRLQTATTKIQLLLHGLPSANIRYCGCAYNSNIEEPVLIVSHTKSELVRNPPMKKIRFPVKKMQVILPPVEEQENKKPEPLLWFDHLMRLLDD